MAEEEVIQPSTGPETDPEVSTTQKVRQVIIETDGNTVILKLAEVAGSLELKAILEAVLDTISQGGLR